VTPGFVDLQFNGGYGRDFTENLSALLDVACRLPETGVAAFLPTFITGPLKACPAILRAVASAQAAHRKCWPVFNCSKRCAC
jgi:N-acetylglucosamine-6-phosphate deacetylase